MVRERQRKDVAARAELAAEERVLDALVGPQASAETRQKFRKQLREGKLADREVELELTDTSGQQLPTFDIPGMPGGQVGMINLSEMLGKAFGGRAKRRKLGVAEALKLAATDESDKLLDKDAVVKEGIHAAEQNGIVFIDELDKICARSEFRGGADVSREGVQRDLLPLIEGTTVATKYGPVKSDHVLFIASGAFHMAKPADLLPELQGRLPIRVELKALTRADFRRILTDTEFSLLKQYTALLKTEQVDLAFADGAIDAIADLAEEVNQGVENIGARRLYTIMEKLLEDISFTAADRAGTTITLDGEYVRQHVGQLAKNADLSRFIL
jgi:ATP-dependent HslUV protease ATP-binding subunit HslU